MAEKSPLFLNDTLEALSVFLHTKNYPSYRAAQVFHAIYRMGKRQFADITTIPKSLRHELSACYSLSLPRITQHHVSKDGTQKFGFCADDGGTFEAVFIPEVAAGRRTHTLCISSQTGCAVGCRFCFTASLTRHRNLETAEIVGQVLAVLDTVKMPIHNIVFMGMGEPLLNYENVVRSIHNLLSPHALDFSSRRVTVSTAGIVPNILKLGHEVPVQLAVSLNASNDTTRTQIMPINKKWPIATLLDTLKAYPLRPRRRITVEYVLLKDINDSDTDAHNLVRLLRDIPVKVNLIPLNPHDRTVYQTPTSERVAAFQHILWTSGMHTMIRRTRGQDIAAACGRLGNSSAA
jgi:23S rRNA (adenine2503-C2)-methyltransferase